MDKRVYWIWLQNAFGPGSAKPKQIMDRMGDPVEFYRGGIGLWSSFRFISDKELMALNMYGPEQAAAALEYCLRLGRKVITPDSSMYPDLLKEIYNPPAVLYVDGDMPDFSNTLWISAVGTRKASDVGLNAAKDICYQLAKHGAVIVSGGALGVDTQAHYGALAAGGKTVAVLPCGLDYPYLMDNAQLRREILDTGGALISEFSLSTPVQRGAFQIRNRLLSGMAHGVLVTEAPKKSGALITARHALEQDREVFAFVGLNEVKFAGCIALTEDGAHRVRTAEDILRNFEGTLQKPSEQPVLAPYEDFEEITEEKSATELRDNRETQKEETIPGVSGSALSVLSCLSDKPKHVSEIEAETDMPAGEIMAALTELELFGLVHTSPGQRFTKA
ncbi:MAG: DNA-processing protein DprA [Clostridia bacterium]|nr:DNA-processing protein DprA [Clostridia bacterium]